MVAGIGSALTIPAILGQIGPLQAFARAHQLNLDVSVGFLIVFLLSVAGCLLGTFLTAPEDEEVLKSFYKRVRPWGFWGPVLKKVQAEDPTFQPNGDFFKDMFNVAVGIVWQIALVALPIYIVIRKMDAMWMTLGIVLATSAILKFSWYDRLPKPEHEMAPDSSQA
jgi:hypothetical protein